MSLWIFDMATSDYEILAKNKTLEYQLVMNLKSLTEFKFWDKTTISKHSANMLLARENRAFVPGKNIKIMNSNAVFFEKIPLRPLFLLPEHPPFAQPRINTRAKAHKARI